LKKCAFSRDLSAILVFIDLKENAMNPRPLLHLEGAAVLIVSLLSYHWSQGSWLQLALLFLVPDLSMLGYAANIRVGAIAYNAVHTYVGHWCWLFTRSRRIALRLYRSPSSGSLTSALIACLDSG
jgi:hypothetical protein